MRRSTANRFYESLLVNGEESLIPPENLEEVKNILISTDWEEAVDVIRPVRNTMCSLMDVRVPVMKKKI